MALLVLLLRCVRVTLHPGHPTRSFDLVKTPPGLELTHNGRHDLADRWSASALACWLFICRQARRDVSVLSCGPNALVGGAGGTRTPDFRLAKAALSQLSYGPPVLEVRGGRWEVGLYLWPPTSSFQLPRLVGHPGLEPGTSVLSGPRSNRLS